MREAWSPRDAAYLFLLVLLPFAFLGVWVFGHQTLYLYDMAWFNAPEFRWIHAQLSAGREVAWDQSVLCGAPRLDESLSACLYPPLRVALRLWEGVRAYGVFQAAHMAWAACGAYLWVRGRGLRSEAALLGALTAGFSGGLIYFEYAWPVLVSISWFSWMLLGLDLAHGQGVDGRRLGMAVLGMAVGMAFLGGHPGMSFLELGVLGLLHLVWLGGAPGWSRALPTWRAIAVAAALAACLYGGQAAAIRRASAQSLRGQPLSVEQSSQTSLSPAAFGEMLLPHALGRRANDSFLGVGWRFGTYEPQGLLAYIGLLGLLLAALGFLARPKELWPLGLAWGLLLFYALGRWNPAYAWICRLPVLNHLRAPDRAISLTGCLAALPVAVGAQAVWSSRRLKPALWLGAFGLALLALTGILWMEWQRLQSLGHAYILGHMAGDALHHQSPDFYEARLLRWGLNLRSQLLGQAGWALGGAAALAWLAWAPPAKRLPVLLLAGLLFADLAVNGRAYLSYIDADLFSHVPAVVEEIRQRSDPAAPVRTFTWGYESALRRAFPQGRMEGDLQGEERVQEALKANLNRNYDLDTANGYSALWLTRMQPLLGWVDDGNPFEDAAASEAQLALHRRALDLAGVRWVASAVPLGLAGLRLVWSGQELLYENLHALPMAYVAGRSSGGWTAATAWAALSGDHTAQAAWPLPALLEDHSAEATGRGQVRWLEYRDDRWALRVDVAGGPGVLVLSRVYYPGPWLATVDGSPADLVPANAAFCALHLAPGSHEVTVEYRDPLLRWSRVLILAGLMLALGLLTAAWRPWRERA